MHIERLTLLKPAPPGTGQFTHHIEILRKKQRRLAHYPKTIPDLRKFKQEYPILPRYQSPHSSLESLNTSTKKISFRFFTQQKLAKTVFIFFPGGNFCYDQTHDYDRFLETILSEQINVIVPILPFAPSQIFPQIHDEATTFVQHVLNDVDNIFNASEVIIGGAGSGAHIAMHVYNQFKQNDKIKKMILIDGLYQMNALALADLPSPETLSGTLGCYFVDYIHHAVSINPLQNDCKIQIPTLVVTGSAHTLAHESIQLAAIAGFYSRSIDLLISPGAIHEFLMYDYPQSKETMRLISDWVEKH